MKIVIFERGDQSSDEADHLRYKKITLYTGCKRNAAEKRIFFVFIV